MTEPYQTLLTDRRGDVAIITLNRPDVMNALNTRMRAEITDAIVAAADARVVVLTGAGRAFCSGQDLSEAENLTPEKVEAILSGEYEPILRAIVDCPAPVLAVVNGIAVGAGANLALACDIVIACESARFIQAFTRIGLMPDAGGTWLLPRLIGQARALGAMLLAEDIPARQAATWGMIWESVPDDVFAAHWAVLAERLAEGPTGAYRSLRQAVRAGATNDLESQLRLEASLQAGCAGREDFAEGIAAFREKRAPRFNGD